MCDCVNGWTHDTYGAYPCCDPAEEVTCVECEGEGQILVHDVINNDSFYLICDTCNGVGKLEVL